MAVKTWYEVRGNVAVLQIDNPPVNGLSHAVRESLLQDLERALDDPAVAAVVITGTDRTFSGGADIREFSTPAALAEPSLLQLIEAVEVAPKPVIAAINGVCMGGGLELSLACAYRVATPNALLGLPEVKLGLLPGAGGTQRLPRAVGADKALKMIVSGDPIDADDALKCGLIARIVSAGSFDGVLAFAAGILQDGVRPRLRDQGVTLPGGIDIDSYFAAARAQAARDARGQIAPARCIDAVEASALRPFAEGIEFERGLFIELLQSKESRALRHAFFAERAAARIADVPDDTPQRPIRTVAVVGFGTMGGGIAMAFANAGIPVQVLEAAPAALERGLAACRGLWEASARKGKLSAQEVERRMGLLRPTAAVADLAQADLVIEAVFERMDIKLSLIHI